MCNRYSLTSELSELTDDFRIERVHMPYSQRYNIAPTQLIPVIESEDGERCLSEQRWGLIPYWGKSSVHTNLDTLGDKPYLVQMLRKKRCAVPCSGFYIWKHERKLNNAWRVVHKEQRTFAMPGIYDLWLDSERNVHKMCTVITAGNAFDTEHELPLVLDEPSMDMWLNPEENRMDSLLAMLRSLPRASFRSYPVTPLIENMNLDSPEFILQLVPDMPMIKP